MSKGVIDEKYAVVEQCQKINQAINHTLHLTQRIKFTCFDVSQNFIIFGATSGGLYIFKRDPCSFLKIVPSKGGSLSEVSISPDEKTIALGSVKGSVSLVDHYNKDNTQVGQIYYEHQGNKITCMKWDAQNNELFVGDITGKISVIELSNFLSKTLFQATCAILMQLDSSITQIDTYLNYLIVSSLTRSYLCDTHREYFRQIGKKLRDGCYGACFHHSIKQIQPQAKSAEVQGVKKVFRILKDEETFPSSNIPSSENVRIFCIRPGFRIWEVKIDSSVAKTHQFKDFLKNEPCCILKILDRQEKSRLKVLNPSSSKISPANSTQNYNFGKIVRFSDSFLISYNSFSIFIFHSKTLSLLFWTNYYRNVADIKVVNNNIYIAHSDKFEISVISVANIEFLITNTVLNKQYIACAQLCKIFSDELLRIVKSDGGDKFQLLGVLESNLQKLNENELYQNVAPVLKLIKQNACRGAKQISAGQKLKNGIVVVKNNYALSSAMSGGGGGGVENRCGPSTSVTDNANGSAHSLAAEGAQSATKATEGDAFRILERQFNVKAINSNVDSPQFVALLNRISDINDVVQLFLSYEQSLKTPERSLREWWLHEYLQFVSKRPEPESVINNLETNSAAETYLIEAFVSLNVREGCTCDKCNFPLPNAQKNRPQFYEIGETLVEKCFKISRERALEIVKQVPYMWKLIIDIDGNKNVLNVLPQILQYADYKVLASYVDRFTESTWVEALKLLGVLKKGICLNCHEKFDRRLVKDGLDFSNFALLMTRSLGSVQSVNVLLKNCCYISKGQLNPSFYHSVILYAMRNSRDVLPGSNFAVDFIQNVHSNTDSDIPAQFENLLANSLNNRFKEVFTNCNETAANKLTTVLCVHCLLPILSRDDLIELTCGHVHHKVCLQLIENKCNRCLVLL